MSGELLLDVLSDRGFLAPDLLKKLRADVARQPRTAQALAQSLVAGGHLTDFQAQQALASVADDSSAGLSSLDLDDLTLAEEDDEPPELDNIEDVVQLNPSDDEELELDDVVALDDSDELSDHGLILQEPLVQDASPSRIADSAENSAPVADLIPLDDAEPIAELERVDDGLGDLDGVSNLTEELPDSRNQGILAKLKFGRRYRQNQWDSPLLLIGGGLLISLVVIGCGLLFYLLRGSGDEIFQLAEENYRAQSYKQAIDKYERFLESYPKHPQVSSARVRIRLAQIRDIVEKPDSSVEALETARNVLPLVESEPAFPEAREELAGLLPQILESFVSNAASSEDSDDAQNNLELARKSLELVNNSAYIPTSLRRPYQARINEMQEQMGAVSRRLKQDEELTLAIRRIKELTVQQLTFDAYAVRAKLVSKYPRLDSNEALHQAVVGIATKEREQVVIKEVQKQALSEDISFQTEFKVAVAHRQQGQAPNVGGEVVFILVDGAVYGLDATDGRLLWRRFVGYQTRFGPMPITSQAGADAVVVDGVHNELLRLEALTGDVVWRLAIDEPFTKPVLAEGRILVSTESGALWQVDAATGHSQRQVQFPQGLTTGPCRAQQYLYLPGDHSTLYVCSADDMVCVESFYMGHADASVHVAPVEVGGVLLVFENAGTDFSLLHVIRVDTNGLGLSQPMEPVRMRGQVSIEPVVFGRRILVTTERGDITVLEVDLANSNAPVRQIASNLGTSSQPQPSFPLISGDRVWIADSRLTKYEFQAARGELVKHWINNEGDTFVASLQIKNDVLFHARRRVGLGGVSVTAVGTKDGDENDGKTYWRTDIAVPAAGEVAVVGKNIRSISANGQLNLIGGTELRRRQVESTGSPMSESMGTLAEQISLPSGDLLVAPQPVGKGWMLFGDGGVHSNQQIISLKTPVGKSIIPALPFGSGVLAANPAGTVELLRTDSGQRLVHPFQPSVKVGKQISWLRPVLYNHDEFIITDRSGRMFRIGIDALPQPHLASRSEHQLDVFPHSAPAVAGDTLYVNVGGGVVVSRGLPDFSGGQRWELSGNVNWGPQRVGDSVLVSSDAGELWCWNEADLQWQSKLPSWPIAGTVLQTDGKFVMSLSKGEIVALSVETGEEIFRRDVGEPLGTGPIKFGGRYLLTAADGTLMVVSDAK